jgi:hypothetical protein
MILKNVAWKIPPNRDGDILEPTLNFGSELRVHSCPFVVSYCIVTA